MNNGYDTARAVNAIEEVQKGPRMTVEEFEKHATAARDAADRACRCEPTQLYVGDAKIPDKTRMLGPISYEAVIAERQQEIASLEGQVQALKWCIETILQSDRMGKHS